HAPSFPPRRTGGSTRARAAEPSPYGPARKGRDRLTRGGSSGGGTDDVLRWSPAPRPTAGRGRGFGGGQITVVHHGDCGMIQPGLTLVKRSRPIQPLRALPSHVWLTLGMPAASPGALPAPGHALPPVMMPVPPIRACEAVTPAWRPPGHPGRAVPPPRPRPPAPARRA